ncbi:unnamed protein product [Auanema sp. JU1783]|nr:unnamed protein product [Auanema sp. JU1783]
MMLRSRSTNANNIMAGNLPAKPGDALAKRGRKPAVIDENVMKGEPKAKRAALCDLSNAISNVLIDSSKKNINVEKKQITNKRGSKRSNSASELSVIPESENKDASIIEIPVEDPCPSYDFDSECANDPFSVHMFALDIFKYGRAREKVFQVSDYMKAQKFVRKENRAILCDWMVEIQETFELNHETLYLAVKLVDMYLECETNTPKSELQLIACAALFVASKFDERSPPLIDDFLYVTDETFSREDLIKMEMKLLKTVGYDLGAPLSYSFVRRYARTCRADMATLTLARYILETSLLFYEFVGTSESRLAAACFLLALKMKSKNATWTPVLHKYSGYRQDEIEPLMSEVNHMMHVRKAKYSNLETVASKYDHEVFYYSASVPLLEDKFDVEKPVQAPLGQGF